MVQNDYAGLKNTRQTVTTPAENVRLQALRGPLLKSPCALQGCTAVSWGMLTFGKHVLWQFSGLWSTWCSGPPLQCSTFWFGERCSQSWPVGLKLRCFQRPVSSPLAALGILRICTVAGWRLQEWKQMMGRQFLTAQSVPTLSYFWIVIISRINAYSGGTV